MYIRNNTAFKHRFEKIRRILKKHTKVSVTLATITFRGLRIFYTLLFMVNLIEKKRGVNLT